MSEKPWYDGLLSIFPEPYRVGVLRLVVLVFWVFLAVRLAYGFDWDTTLTSFYFHLPCGLVLTGFGVYFLWRTSSHGHRYLGVFLIAIGLTSGYFAYRDYSLYAYQIDYKFSNRWRPFPAPEDFLRPVESDERDYWAKYGYERRLEPISDRVPGRLLLTVSIQDLSSQVEDTDQACHLLRSRIEFNWRGLLQPDVTHQMAESPDEPEVWTLQGLRKHMQIGLQVAVGQTKPSAKCEPMLEVREQ